MSGLPDLRCRFGGIPHRKCPGNLNIIASENSVLGKHMNHDRLIATGQDSLHSTSHKKTDNALQMEKGRAGITLDSIGDSVLCIDLAGKITGLRIFEDAAGKMNRAVGEAEGSVLVVSQFTLYGDVRHGKRPSFDAAAPPEKARALYEYFVERIRAAGLRCETGRFQEMMQVELVNDGPVTILLDSSKAF